jgi:hypothetical protein
MGLWDKIRQTLSGRRAEAGDVSAYWVYVRCGKCGETIRTRVDLRNDLSLQEGGEGYFTHKTLIGRKRCFNPVEVYLYFDANRQLVERVIEGGTFIDPSEYRED